MRISDWSSDVCSSDLGLFPGATPVYALPSSVLDSVGLGTLLNPTFHCGMSPSCDIDQAIAFADANGKRIAYTDQYPQSSVSLFGISNTTTFTLGDTATVKNRSEEHTSELQSLMRISYAVFCLKKKKHTQTQQTK